MRSYLMAAAGALALAACGGNPKCPDGWVEAGKDCIAPGGAGHGGSKAAEQQPDYAGEVSRVPPTRDVAGGGGIGGAGESGKRADTDAGAEPIETSRVPPQDAGKPMHSTAGSVAMGPLCGNGIRDKGETCDGDCPTDCDDSDPCTADTWTGSADHCSFLCAHQPITKNIDADGCCLNALSSEDSDCTKECDLPGDCPKVEECFRANCTAGRCDPMPIFGQKCGDGGSCLSDGTCGPGQVIVLPGMTTMTEPKCGDGHVDTGELCDGDCPKCDDGNPCTVDASSGTAATCDVKCSHTNAKQGTDCGSGNRCDASGKCVAPKCGDGVVDPGEKCDGNCPTTCADDGDDCTLDGLNFVSMPCQTVCEHVPKTAGSVCNNGGGVCSDATGTGFGCLFAWWFVGCDSDGACGGASCIDHICTVKCTGNDGQCPSGSMCSGGSCKERCSSGTDCPAGQKCGAGMCAPIPCPNGGSCPTGSQCISDFCVTNAVH